MAQQTLPIPDNRYLELGTTARWFLPAGSRLPVDSAITGGPTRLLADVVISGAGLITLRFTENQTESSGSSGGADDLSDTFEATGGFTITVGAFELTVELAGADVSEPYVWTPSNSAEVITFNTNVRAINGDESATLVLRDVPLRHDAVGTLDGGLTGSLVGAASLLSITPLDAVGALDGGLAGSVAGVASLSTVDAMGALTGGLAGTLAGVASLSIAPLNAVGTLTGGLTGSIAGSVTLVTIVVPTEPAAPTVPRFFTTTPTGRQSVDLAWQAPASDGRVAITHYQICVIDEDGSVSPFERTDDARLTWRVRGLALGHEYGFRVRAVNAVGVGLATEIVKTIPIPASVLTIPPGHRIPLLHTDRQSLIVRLADIDCRIAVFWQPSDVAWYATLEVPVNTVVVSSKRLAVDSGILDRVKDILPGNIFCRALESERMEPQRDAWRRPTHALIWTPD